MFSSFFYSSNGEDVCRRFLSLAADGKTAIVVDPPFGGLAKVLARGIKNLWNMAKEGIMTYYVHEHNINVCGQNFNYTVTIGLCMLAYY